MREERISSTVTFEPDPDGSESPRATGNRDVTGSVGRGALQKIDHDASALSMEIAWAGVRGAGRSPSFRSARTVMESRDSPQGSERQAESASPDGQRHGPAWSPSRSPLGHRSEKGHVESVVLQPIRVLDVAAEPLLTVCPELHLCM
jgi:hypothetical protein